MGLVRAETGLDAGAVVHCGDPAREQRDLDAGIGWVDLSHRGVFTVAGPDRLTWLHAMTTQHLLALAPHQGTTALLLDAQGHIEHALFLVDDGEVLWGHTEPGRVGDLVAFLDRMRFLSRVEVTDRSADLAVVWTVEDPDSFPTPLITRRADDSLGGTDLFLPRTALAALDERPHRAGLWAYEARRIAAGVARIGLDTDERTIPNEIGVLGGAVHMDKGCYTGQETVARVWNLGRPPRRLVRLQLDGSVDRLPDHGEEVALRDDPERPIGVVGSAARHHEQGPIALALVKRTVPVDAPLVISEIAAGQEVLVDPEVGLHVRPGRG